MPALVFRRNILWPRNLNKLRACRYPPPNTCSKLSGGWGGGAALSCVGTHKRCIMDDSVMTGIVTWPRSGDRTSTHKNNDEWFTCCWRLLMMPSVALSTLSLLRLLKRVLTEVTMPSFSVSPYVKRRTARTTWTMMITSRNIEYWKVEILVKILVKMKSEQAHTSGLCVTFKRQWEFDCEPTTVERQ